MLRACLLCIGLALSSLSQAAYSALYAFGDSLLDSGNFYTLSGSLYPPSPPYAERFSNGPTAGEYLADRLGITFTPSVEGGTNFATGGATTGLLNYGYEIGHPPGLPPAVQFTGMQSQVTQFLAAGPTFDPAASLFLIWGGPNDLSLALAQGGDLLEAADTAIGNLIGIVGALVGAGATDLLVPDLPNLARTPLGLGLGDEQRIGLDRLTIAFNQALAAGLQQIRDGMLFAVPADLKLIGLDSNALLDGVIANPEAFGFSDVTSSCLSALAAGTAVTCEGFLFFDDMHPTTAMHRLIGDRFFTRIPEPSTSALLAIALFAALRSRGTLREH